MNKKRMIALLLAIAVIISLMTVGIVAFGNDITWHYDVNSDTLYINGTTDMDDYEGQYDVPWNEYMNTAKHIVISEGVTSIGAYSFAGMSKLESIEIPDSVTAIKSYSMSSCPCLTELDFGANITSIADVSFAYDGVAEKQHFVVNTVPASYPLYYAIKNSINFSTPSVTCGTYVNTISVAGMKGYYPYTPECDGTFRFYSIGAYDTIGYLYDSSFTQLAKNDDASASDTNFSITAELTKGETYYISASMFSGGIRGSFNFTIEALSFTVDCELKAMLSPSGEASDISLIGVMLDGVTVPDGFTIDVTGDSVTKTFTFGSQTKTITFTPDTKSVITFVACDVNDDGYINAKDFAIMRKTSSPYLPLFENFINYSY